MHRVADRLEHPPDLPVPALVEGELDPAGAEQPRARGRRPPVLQLDALRERPHRLVVRLALDVRDVDLLDAVARVRKAVRELAVVRQEEDARRVPVEPPDGHDADGAADEVDHGRSPLRVACGRDRAARLVEEDVAERLLADETTVDADVVGRLDERVELSRLAVDGDAPGLDELVGAATRGDPGAREVGVQAHAVHSGRVRSRVVRDIADLTRRFADLIVGFGANVQPGQIVGITTNPGKEELTRAGRARGVRAWRALGRRLHARPVGQAAAARPRRRVDPRLRAALDGRPARVVLGRACGADHADRERGAGGARRHRSRSRRQGRPAVPPEHRRRRQPGDDELDASRRLPHRAGRVSSTRTSTRTRRTSGCGTRSPTCAGSTRTTPRRRGGSAAAGSRTWRRD